MERPVLFTAGRLAARGREASFGAQVGRAGVRSADGLRAGPGLTAAAGIDGFGPEPAWRPADARMRGDAVPVDIRASQRVAHVLTIPAAREKTQEESEGIPDPAAHPESQRPTGADDGSVFGHWTSDTVIGGVPSKVCPHTCVQRRTRYLKVGQERAGHQRRRAGSLLGAAVRRAHQPHVEQRYRGQPAHAGR